jgi:FkbM family methyltransferase
VKGARRCHVSDLCVYSRSGETLSFIAAQKGELSRLARIKPHDGHEARRQASFVEVMVQTISLNDLLTMYEAPPVIDYMSIDTEGSEFKILQNFDFGRWDVRAMTVEHNNTSAEGKIDALLFANGYRRVWPQISRFDAWYVKAT